MYLMTKESAVLIKIIKIPLFVQIVGCLFKYKS